MVAKTNESLQSVIINSVDRSIDVLEYLLKTNEDTSLSQISKDLNIYKSTVFRTLATLENRGYVTQNKTSELYSIGPKLYSYGRRIKTNVIIKSILPFLDEIKDKYGETASFSTLDTDSNGLYSINLLANVKGTHNLSVSTDLSSQTECNCASIGKCLLAFTEDINLDVYKDCKLEKFTENTITTYSGLIKEIDKVKEQGYAVDDEEREIGLFCLGVPIMSAGTAVGAISISGPASRIRDNNLEEKISYMKKMSEKISKAVFV